MSRPPRNPLPERVALGLTQAQFAERVGVCTDTISSIESGRMKPSPEMALVLLACSSGGAIPKEKVMAMVDKRVAEYREALMKRLGL